jgi:lysophospholipase L1-like esterase
MVGEEVRGAQMFELAEVWQTATRTMVAPMRRNSAVVAAAALLALAGATPALAESNTPEGFGEPVYLALGDSVAAGAGAQPFVSGYPEQTGALLADGYNVAADKATPNADTDLQVVNYAMGGATTASLIQVQLPKAIALIEERLADRDPFNDVAAISVTIGGNDIFNPVVGACVLDTTPTDCQTVVDAVLAATEAGVAEILQRLTAAAGQHTEVIITTYYNPLGSCFLGQANPVVVDLGDAVLEGGAVAGLVEVTDGLNDRIRDAAASSGAQVAELYGELEDGQFVGGRDCLHPNLSGHTTIAGIVYDALAH